MGFFAVFLPAERDVIERGQESGQEGGNVIWWRNADSRPTR